MNEKYIPKQVRLQGSIDRLNSSIRTFGTEKGPKLFRPPATEMLKKTLGVIIEATDPIGKMQAKLEELETLVTGVTNEPIFRRVSRLYEIGQIPEETFRETEALVFDSVQNSSKASEKPVVSPVVSEEKQEVQPKTRSEQFRKIIEAAGHPLSMRELKILYKEKFDVDIPKGTISYVIWKYNNDPRYRSDPAFHIHSTIVKEAVGKPHAEYALIKENDEGQRPAQPELSLDPISQEEVARSEGQTNLETAQQILEGASMDSPIASDQIIAELYPGVSRSAALKRLSTLFTKVRIKLKISGSELINVVPPRERLQGKGGAYYIQRNESTDVRNSPQNLEELTPSLTPLPEVESRKKKSEGFREVMESATRPLRVKEIQESYKEKFGEELKKATLTSLIWKYKNDPSKLSDPASRLQTTFMKDPKGKIRAHYQIVKDAEAAVVQDELASDEKTSREGKSYDRFLEDRYIAKLTVCEDLVVYDDVPVKEIVETIGETRNGKPLTPQQIIYIAVNVIGRIQGIARVEEAKLRRSDKYVGTSDRERAILEKVRNLLDKNSGEVIETKELWDLLKKRLNDRQQTVEEPVLEQNGFEGDSFEPELSSEKEDREELPNGTIFEKHQEVVREPLGENYDRLFPMEVVGRSAFVDLLIERIGVARTMTLEEVAERFAITKKEIDTIYSRHLARKGEQLSLTDVVNLLSQRENKFVFTPKAAKELKRFIENRVINATRKKLNEFDFIGTEKSG